MQNGSRSYVCVMSVCRLYMREMHDKNKQVRIQDASRWIRLVEVDESKVTSDINTKTQYSKMNKCSHAPQQV